MDFKNVVTFYQKAYPRMPMNVLWDEEQFEVLSVEGDMRRIQKVDPALTRKLNRTLGVQNQFLVMEVHDHEETKYRPRYHVVYYLIENEKYVCKTKFIVSKNTYLNAHFAAYSFLSGQLMIKSLNPDDFTKDRQRIFHMHFAMRELLFETNRYRLEYVTGGLK